MTWNFLHALVVSLSLGALIGMVRQWAEQRKHEELNEGVAGLRTFGSWALLGCLTSYLSTIYTIYLVAVVLLALAGFLTASMIISRDDKQGTGVGLTSFSLALLTYFVGCLVHLENYTVAIVLSAAMMIIIAAKRSIHQWTLRMTQEDMFLAVQFAAVSGLILPLVPNQGYGPFEAFNPYQIWLMVVLISGLGFAGYIAMRLLGTRSGIVVTGIAGGLASSTATTLALSRNSKETPALSAVFARGIVIANTIVIGRVLILLIMLNPGLFRTIAIPTLVMALPTLLWILWHFIGRKKKDQVEMPTLRNPLSLKLAIKFALLYGLIVFLIKAMSELGAEVGFYPIAFLSGLSNMDAITLSLANTVSENSLDLSVAARGILLAAVANTLFKLTFAVVLGAKELRRHVATGMIPMILFGVIAIFLVA